MMRWLVLRLTHYLYLGVCPHKLVIAKVKTGISHDVNHLCEHGVGKYCIILPKITLFL